MPFIWSYFGIRFSPGSTGDRSRKGPLSRAGTTRDTIVPLRSAGRVTQVVMQGVASLLNKPKRDLPPFSAGGGLDPRKLHEIPRKPKGDPPVILRDKKRGDPQEEMVTPGEDNLTEIAYQRFREKCGTLSRELQLLIPNRDEINPKGIIRRSKYISRLRGIGTIDQTIEIFEELLG